MQICNNLAGILLQKGGKKITCSLHKKKEAPPKCCIPPTLLPPLGRSLPSKCSPHCFHCKRLIRSKPLPFSNCSTNNRSASQVILSAIVQTTQRGRLGLPVLVTLSDGSVLFSLWAPWHEIQAKSKHFFRQITDCAAQWGSLQLLDI